MPDYPWLDQSKCFDADVYETGWREIIEWLLAEVDVVAKATSVKVEAHQVKEKLGRLCIHHRVYGASPVQQVAIRTMINRAYDKSLSTCIVCGDKGALRNSDGLLEVVCASHTQRDGC